MVVGENNQLVPTEVTIVKKKKLQKIISTVKTKAMDSGWGKHVQRCSVIAKRTQTKMYPKK